MQIENLIIIISAILLGTLGVAIILTNLQLYKLSKKNKLSKEMRMKEAIQSLVELKNADFSLHKPSTSLVSEMQKRLHIKFGKQLKYYLWEYGYLGCGHIELFGLNSKQGACSDMIGETERLHKQFPETRKLIAIEDQGDGNYYLVDKNNRMYHFVSEDKTLKKLEKSLYGYIYERLSSVEIQNSGSEEGQEDE